MTRWCLGKIRRVLKPAQTLRNGGPRPALQSGMALTPATASMLADAVLALHVAIVAFVVLGEMLFLIGGWRGWRWIRSLPLRLLHLALMVFVAIQAWLGALCPLTVWEQRLRALAGQTGYQESFIEHWLSKLIFFQAPWWIFVAAYTAFALLVLATWWRFPPRRGGWTRVSPRASAPIQAAARKKP